MAENGRYDANGTKVYTFERSYRHNDIFHITLVNSNMGAEKSGKSQSPNSRKVKKPRFNRVLSKSEFKFTEGDFCLNRGLSADFLALLFTKKNTSYLKCKVAIIHGRVWFGMDFGC